MTDEFLSLTLLDVDGACAVLNISKPKLYHLSSIGAIRKIKIGACLRFRLSDLETFISENTVEPREPFSI